MKKCLAVLSLAGVLVFGYLSAATATAINLFVDSAPNVYGSPNYSTWWNNTKAAVTGGTFVNMSNGANPDNVGTTNFEIQDEVVYSFGDLGKRLTWIYWMPDTTLDQAASANFEIKLESWWDGSYQDFYLDTYGASWQTPTRWEEVNGGVIGTAGMAWWGAYGENTPEALVANLLDWGRTNESWKFSAQMDDGTYSYLASIKSNREGVAAPVPEPASILLFGTGLVGLLGYGRRGKKE